MSRPVALRLALPGELHDRLLALQGTRQAQGGGRVALARLVVELLASHEEVSTTEERDEYEIGRLVCVYGPAPAPQLAMERDRIDGENYDSDDGFRWRRLRVEAIDRVLAARAEAQRAKQEETR